MIVIFCPWGNATGGTEVLHQLGYTLNNLGIQASIYYYNEVEGKPAIHPHFYRYNVPRIETLLEAEEYLVVLPEAMAVNTEKIKQMLPKSRIIIWWLSVDNAKMREENEAYLRADTQVIHFVQSEYALKYVSEKIGIENSRIFHVADYINNAFLIQGNSLLAGNGVAGNAITGNSTTGNVAIGNGVARENVVLFNPRKGIENVLPIIAKSNASVSWKALSQIVPEDMPEVLSRAKVYIDFGNHPGKDRIPREAAVCGCRVITGRRGSANNPIDVNIPDECKFADGTDVEKILETIYYLTEHYEESAGLYEEYVAGIKEEFHGFECDVLQAFYTLLGVDYSDVSEMDLLNTVATHLGNQDFVKAYSYMVLYRLMGFELSNDFLMMEACIRVGLGEFEQAEYLANTLVTREENYNYYMILVEAIFAGGRIKKDRVRYLLAVCQKTLLLAKGTADEEYTFGRIDEMITVVNEIQ